MESQLTNIVVGVSRLVAEDPVLRGAAELARRTGATLVLAHAFAFGDPVEDAYERLGVSGARSERHFRDALQATLAALAAGAGAPGPAWGVAAEGAAEEVLSDVAARVGADLLVIGASHHAPLLRGLGASTAERVIRWSPAPVMVLRRPLPGGSARVLFATDLSEFSTAAFERGLATTMRAAGGELPEVRVLLVVPYSTLQPPPLQERRLEELARLELSRFLDGRGSDGPTPRGRIRFGDPANEIAREAQEWRADLLVMGTHGKSGLNRLLMGSVAATALRGTHCNLLVVPPGAVHHPHPQEPEQLSLGLYPADAGGWRGDPAFATRTPAIPDGHSPGAALA